MDIRSWGSNGWKFLHACTFGYSDMPSQEEQRGCVLFFQNLKYMLPCPKCRRNYEQKLRTHPIEEACHSKEALSKWLVEMHNLVNVSTNKSQVSYEEACNLYRLGPPKSLNDDDCDTPNCAESGGRWALSKKKVVFAVCTVVLLLLLFLVLIRRTTKL